MNITWPLMIHADKSRVGKDYAAQKIVQVLAQKGIKAQQFSIALPLKVFCRKYFNTRSGLEYEIHPELRDEALPLVGVGNVVDLWIKVGEFFRTLKPTFWIKQCCDDIVQGSYGHALYVPVISDYRFDCEYEYIHNVFEGHVSTLKINSNKGVFRESDGLVTRLADYSVTNYFDDNFNGALEAFCDEFIKDMNKTLGQ